MVLTGQRIRCDIHARHDAVETIIFVLQLDGNVDMAVVAVVAAAVVAAAVVADVSDVAIRIAVRFGLNVNVRMGFVLVGIVCLFLGATGK